MNTDRIKKVLLYSAITFLSVYFITIIIVLIYGRGVCGHKSGKIGIIKIEGVIFSSSSTVAQIKDVKENDIIKAIVIRIDSPGGSVTPSQEIYHEIIKLKNDTNKKVVVSMANTAASGGYYIACAADKIMANAGTITGSIGVITRIPNLEGLFGKIGYEEQVVKSGKFKDIGSSSRPLTQEEEKILQDTIDDIHDQFIEAVSESRNIDKEDVKKIADGRIFTGRQAMKIHLIDELGTMEDAIDLAADLVGIAGKPSVLNLREERTIYDIFKDFVGQVFKKNPLDWSPIRLQYILI